jgi:hypothetical protein
MAAPQHAQTSIGPGRWQLFIQQRNTQRLLTLETCTTPPLPWQDSNGLLFFPAFAACPPLVAALLPGTCSPSTSLGAYRCPHGLLRQPKPHARSLLHSGTVADEDTQRPKPVAAAADDDNNTGLKRIEEGKQLLWTHSPCQWTRIRKPQGQPATAWRELISLNAM